VAYCLLIGIALLLRVVFLGEKPMHHDESEDAWMAWRLFTGKGYRYDPVFHGPLRFYLISGSYWVLGVSDASARLAPALMGTLLVGLPYFLRRHVGKVAAFASAILLCFSPSFLYFSRFTREDIYFACITLGLIVAVLNFLSRPRRGHPTIILSLLALSFATKETTFITVFVAGLFFLGVAARQARATDGNRHSMLAAVKNLGLDAWLWGFASFILISTLLFSSFLSNPQGLPDGVFKGIQYWLSQQPVHRGDQPWFYYLTLLSVYEWPAVLLAIVGCVAIIRLPSVAGVFLIWGFVGSLLVYSWASERFSWLVLPPLLPLLLLAGIGVQAIWEQRRGTVRAAGIVFIGLGAANALYAGLTASFAHPSDPAELLVYTQTTNQARDLSGALLSMDTRLRTSSGKHLSVTVDSWGGAAWPWAWYLRDLPTVGYPDLSVSAPFNSDVIIVTDQNRARLTPQQIAGFTGYKLPLRSWWIPDNRLAQPAAFYRWLVFREPSNPRGYFDEWVYIADPVREK